MSSSPIKPWSAKNSPKKGLFLLTNTNMSGKKKAPVKESPAVMNRREELSKILSSNLIIDKMYSMNKDQLIDKTMKDVNLPPLLKKFS